MIRSVRARLGVAAGAAVLVGGAVLSLWILSAFRSSLLRSAAANLEADARRIGESPDEGLGLSAEAGAGRIRYAALLDAGGAPIESEGAPSDGAPGSAAVRAALAGRPATLVEPIPGLLVAAIPIPDEPDEDWSAGRPGRPAPRAVLLVGSTRETDEAVRALRRLLLAAVLASALLAGLGGGWLGGRALAPVAALARWADGLDGRDLRTRVDVPRTGDEISRLAETLNRMAGRIEEAFARNARFVADASHEIRNPLTNLSTEIQSTLRRERGSAEYRAALSSVLEEVRRLSRLADGLLFLSRADAGRAAGAMEAVDLAAVARAAASGLSEAARRKGLDLRVEGADDIRVRGDAAALTRLAENLVENAVRYVPKGGRIEVLASAREDWATLTVSDDGPGVPPADLARAFERFWRGDRARVEAPQGAGLGLSISREIAAAHGGSIALGGFEAGGCRVEVLLPRLHAPFISN